MKKLYLTALSLLCLSANGVFGQVISDGRYAIYSRHSGLVLDVEANSADDGANIQQWGYADTQNQQFDIVYRGNGDYSIISAASGKAVEVYDFSTDPGGEIRQWEFWGGDNQLWKITAGANGYYTITSKFNGLNLDVWEWSTAAGGDIRQWTPSGANNQLFRFEQVAGGQPSCASLRDGGLYKIINYSSKKSLDISGASRNSGGNVIQWAETGGANQLFYLRQVDGTDHWVIEASHSNQALEVADGSTSNGANIQQWGYAGGSHQQWRLLQSANFDGAYAIVSVRSGKSLTVAGSASGDNIYQNSDAASSSQRWYISSVDTGCGGTGSSGGSNNYAAGVSGFAAQYGADGLSTTTGGDNASPVRISSCSQLQQLVQGDSKKVLQLPDSTLDCRSANRSQSVCRLSCGNGSSKPLYRIATSSQTCEDLGGSSNSMVYLNTNDSRIQVGSNTTIVGLGKNARVIGGTFDLGGASNVILKNFTISDVNAGIIEAGDAISLNNSSHIWIDHMRMSKISDGLLDSYNSRNVTVSWSHFDGVNDELCWGTDPYVSMLENTEATFHHNFFDSGYGRNPKIGGSASRVHLYNNFWKDIYYFSMSVSDGARAKVDGNYYENASRPHWNSGGYIYANTGSNRYTGSSASSTRDNSGSASWDVNMYSYSLDIVDNIPSAVGSGVGPK